MAVAKSSLLHPLLAFGLGTTPTLGAIWKYKMGTTRRESYEANARKHLPIVLTRPISKGLAQRLLRERILPKGFRCRSFVQRESRTPEMRRN
jgi:hypothetical protein